jgi:hypothetical protein
MKRDETIIRARITLAMVGADCLLVTSGNYDGMQYGEEHNAEISSIADALRRSKKQMDLYWKICEVVADSTDDVNWNTKDNTDEQLKLLCGYHEPPIYVYDTESKITRVHLKTKSIAFHNLRHIEACGYFTDAFQRAADRIGMTVEALVAEAKSRMRSRA